MKAVTTTLVGLLMILAGCTATDTTDGDGGAMVGSGDLLVEAVPLVNHVQFGMFEQDVYIEKVDAEADKVYRPTPADAASPLYADAPLFSSAEMHEHDPSGQDAGPFDKGEALGFTLAEWLAASGSMAYACNDGRGHITGTFAGLVADGVYTVWNAQLTFEDGAIVAGTDYPAGPADGSANTFTADGDGNGRVSIAWDDCNEASTFDGMDGQSWVLAIAYHSDGQTYGDEPGDFGKATHVQLFGLAKQGST